MIEPTDNKNPFDSISLIILYSFIALFIVLGLSIIIGSFWLIVNYPQKIEMLNNSEMIELRVYNYKIASVKHY